MSGFFYQQIFMFQPKKCSNFLVRQHFCFKSFLWERCVSIVSIFNVFGTSGDQRNSPEGKHCLTGPKYWLRDNSSTFRYSTHTSSISISIFSKNPKKFQKILIFWYTVPVKNTYTKYELLTPTDKKMRSLWRGTRNSLQGVIIRIPPLKRVICF